MYSRCIVKWTAVESGLSRTGNMHNLWDLRPDDRFGSYKLLARKSIAIYWVSPFLILIDSPHYFQYSSMNQIHFSLILLALARRASNGESHQNVPT